MMFTSSLAQVHHSVVFEEQAKLLEGYDQQYRQLSAGNFCGDFFTSHICDGVSVYIEQVNRVIESIGHVPNGTVGALTLLNSLSLPGYMGNISSHCGEVWLLTEGHELEYRSPKDSLVCVISIDKKLLSVQNLERSKCYLSDSSNPLSRRLHSLCQILLVCAAGPTTNLARAYMAAAFVENIDALFSAQLLHESELPRRHSNIVVNHAKQKIIQNIHSQTEPLTIAELAQELNISKRTLEYAFQEHLGMTPKTYSNRLKLNMIRQSLIAEQNVSIGDIAARYHIWHLGRLSENYKKMFGELPSESQSSLS